MSDELNERRPAPASTRIPIAALRSPAWASFVPWGITPANSGEALLPDRVHPAHYAGGPHHAAHAVRGGSYRLPLGRSLPAEARNDARPLRAMGAYRRPAGRRRRRHRVERRPRRRTAIITGSCVGGQKTVDEGFVTLYKQGKPRVNPMTIPRTMANAGASQISMEFGVTGPAWTISTACSSSNHAIGQAYWMVRNGACRDGHCRRQRGAFQLTGF